ncbi:MAG TPA: glycosyltransferase, partial [Burkholderiaceae bacterium]|nr:glycosyltransferase [Burkholderiaceae bacterium]
EEAAAIPYIRAAAADREESLQGELKNRIAEIHNNNLTIIEQTDTINRQVGTIGQQSDTINAQSDTIHSQAGTIDAQAAEIGQRNNEIGGLNAEINRLLGENSHQATEIANHRTTISTLSDQRQELERELSGIKLGNWYRLGRALKDDKFSLKKLLKIAYFFTACAVPSSLKPTLRPAVNRLRKLYERKSSPTKTVAPQLIQQTKSEDDGRPRVLHVIGNFMLGGSSQLVVDLIQGLGADYNQHVVTSHLPSPPAYSGVAVSEFRSPRSPEDVIEFLRQYDPSIIHFHYWGDVDWWWYDIFFRAAQTLDCRVIQNVNTPVAPYKADCVDWYVHVSNYVKQQFGDGSARNMTIYPGIDLSLFSRPENMTPASDCIGMVYRLETDKLNEQSIDAFIKVVQLRPHTKVVIIGGGTYLEPYRRATQNAGVADNFEFTGYVDYAKLPELYQKINMFVAPVWKESFGQVTPFAMNFGIPVAGYDVGGLREIIDDASLLAEPGNSTELAEIVVRLLDDPERSRAIGARNHARAQSLFSVEAMVEEYRKLYSGLVEAKQ